MVRFEAEAVAAKAGARQGAPRAGQASYTLPPQAKGAVLLRRAAQAGEPTRVTSAKRLRAEKATAARLERWLSRELIQAPLPFERGAPLMLTSAITIDGTCSIVTSSERGCPSRAR